MDNKKSLKNDLKIRMDKAIDSLDKDLGGLRTGRVTPSLLDPIKVECYGDIIALSEVASVSVDGRTLNVQVWDNNNIKAVEKAISNSNLGLTPNTAGAVIRLNIPALTEERRKDLVKVAAKYAENNKISIRNIRRDALDIAKKLEKDKIIDKDEHHALGEELQKITDEYIAKIDKSVKSKEEEILKL